MSSLANVILLNGDMVTLPSLAGEEWAHGGESACPCLATAATKGEQRMEGSFPGTLPVRAGFLSVPQSACGD